MLYILWTCLIGILCGWLAGKIFKGSGNGLILNLILGLAGSWVGNLLFGWLLKSDGIGGFICSLLGAIVVLWVASKISRKK